MCILLASAISTSIHGFLGRVDERDPQRPTGVNQAGLYGGDRLGTRPDVGGGVDLLQSVPPRCPRPEQAQTVQPPRCSWWVFLDRSDRNTQTGAPSRDLPDKSGKWSSVYRQFWRWTVAGLWDDIIKALNRRGAVSDALQMIDKSAVRAHRQASGARRGGEPSMRHWFKHHGERDMVLAALAVAARPRSTAPSVRMACA